MIRRRSLTRLVMMCAMAAFGGAAATRAAVAAGAAEAPDFNRDVQPILAENCYHCHGPDAAQRKAGLRLDKEESAFELRKGKAAIVRGQPEKSELVRRTGSKDPDV